MSRTYNTRPEWVKLNDPKFPTRELHNHLVNKSEKTGRMITKTRIKWVVRDGWPKTEEEEYEVPEILHWTEVAPCDIDTPHVSWRDRRKTWGTDQEKRCEKRPAIRTPCSCCSRWYAKRLSAQAQRASINQQLRNAVRDYGRNCDTDPESHIEVQIGYDDLGSIYGKLYLSNWWDVDITAAGVAEDWDFWD